MPGPQPAASSLEGTQGGGWGVAGIRQGRCLSEVNTLLSDVVLRNRQRCSAEASPPCGIDDKLCVRLRSGWYGRFRKRGWSSSCQDVGKSPLISPPWSGLGLPLVTMPWFSLADHFSFAPLPRPLPCVGELASQLGAPRYVSLAASRQGLVSEALAWVCMTRGVMVLPAREQEPTWPVLLLQHG